MRFPFSFVPPAVRVALAAGLGTVAALGVVGGLIASSACTSTVLGNTALVSGIFINTSGLLDNGTLGCGTADAGTEVYKYVAVVINENHDVGGAGIFDCFADGVFANLPGTDAGTLNFAVWVYAYNYADFQAANAPNAQGQSNALINAVAGLNGLTLPDGGMINVPITVPKGGAGRGNAYAAALSEICLQKATWTTTCSATTQSGVQVLADCGSLQPENSVPSACSLPVQLPEGGPG